MPDSGTIQFTLCSYPLVGSRVPDSDLIGEHEKWKGSFPIRLGDRLNLICVGSTGIVFPLLFFYLKLAEAPSKEFFFFVRHLDRLGRLSTVPYFLGMLLFCNYFIRRMYVIDINYKQMY